MNHQRDLIRIIDRKLRHKFNCEPTSIGSFDTTIVTRFSEMLSTVYTHLLKPHSKTDIMKANLRVIRPVYTSDEKQFFTEKFIYTFSTSLSKQASDKYLSLDQEVKDLLKHLNNDTIQKFVSALDILTHMSPAVSFKHWFYLDLVTEPKLYSSYLLATLLALDSMRLPLHSVTDIRYFCSKDDRAVAQPYESTLMVEADGKFLHGSEFQQTWVDMNVDKVTFTSMLEHPLEYYLTHG